MSDAHGSVRVVPLGDGRYLVGDESARRVAFGARAADGTTWVFLNGRVYVVEPRAPSGRNARGDHDAPLAAPMPATVLRVEAGPGQTVARGDVLLVLEAMKMELPLKAPRDAVVKAVRCGPGELVQPGVPLVELE